MIGRNQFVAIFQDENRLAFSIFQKNDFNESKCLCQIFDISKKVRREFLKNLLDLVSIRNLPQLLLCRKMAQHRTSQPVFELLAGK